jgi:DNA-directed RNA polymerase specialized sigma24 family protein
MTVEELYLKEKDRIEKLARHYARMFSSEAEDLFQEGALTVTEIYAKYGALPDEELFKVSHRVINRKIYKYAQNEYRYKTTSSLESDDTTKTNYS